MAKDLLDKLGFNSFHDMSSSNNAMANVEYSLKYCMDAGVKYIRPAFALQPEEFNNANADWSTHNWGTWRVDPFKMFIRNGIKPILNLYPQQIQGHLLDSNADDLVEQAVTAYTKCIDVLINNGISPSDFIIEAWNEADGTFAANRKDAQQNTMVINRYLTFNKEMCKACNDRGVEFWDFDSITYPNAPEISTVMNQYNSMVSTYTGKPDRITFHPYCERGRDDNRIPEYYLYNFNLTNWDNLRNWGVPFAVSEFGYPSEEWGTPFSGNYPTQYAFSMLKRQIIILDFLQVDPMVVYSANVNPDPSRAGSDECWGTYTIDDKTNHINYSPLGLNMLQWLQSMKGYHQTAFHSSLDDMVDVKNSDINYAWFTAEYQDHNGNKKLFYWSPFGKQDIKYQLDGWNTTLKNANQFIKCIEG